MKKINLIPLLLFICLMACKQDTRSFHIKALEHSIQETQSFLQVKGKMAYWELEDKWLDPMTAGKGEVWLPKAQSVRNISIKAIAYLDSLRNEIVVKHKKPVTLFEPSREEPYFKVLRRLSGYKEAMLAAIDTAGFSENPVLADKLLKDQKKFRAVAPLIKADPGMSETAQIIFEAVNWHSSHFKNVTPDVAVVMLDKLKRDVQLTAIGLIEYLNNEVGVSCNLLKYIRHVEVVNVKKVHVGQSFTITALAGCFLNYERKPRIYIGDSLLLFKYNRLVAYKFKAPGKSGIYHLPVRFEYVERGSIQNAVKNVEYTVVPSGR